MVRPRRTVQHPPWRPLRESRLGYGQKTENHKGAIANRSALIERTIPGKPNSLHQNNRLTAKGESAGPTGEVAGEVADHFRHAIKSP